MTGTVIRLTSALADRYVIEREIGQGGMATVYLAGGEWFLSVPVTTAPAFNAGRIDTLFAGDYEINPTRASYDVSRDGNELIVVGAVGGTRTLSVTLNPLAALSAGGRSPR